MEKKRVASAVSVVFGWVRKQSMKVKIFLGIVLGFIAIVGLKMSVHDHNHFFVASEAIHAAGVFALIFKLVRQKTCSGLSLKSQYVTAIFLAVRMVCSYIMEADIHTVLDFATLISTLWVIYMIRFKLKTSYIKELDNMPLYYLIVPSAILAFLINPHIHHIWISRVMWAFAVNLEAVSVLPQLRLMQNAKMIEPFTAHYVFALGMARFLSFSHWMIRVYETRGRYLWLIGAGYFWFPAAFLAEIVQTFILADFCYYYIKSVVNGGLIVRMPV